jgi:hypothetical protein
MSSLRFLEASNFKSISFNRAKQKAWSEEQEDELRRLFMENQESIEKSQTRRGVIKKLKELRLIFKAPKKKSNAAAANKNLFIKDKDEKLRELYDEHRLESACRRSYKCLTRSAARRLSSSAWCSWV